MLVGSLDVRNGCGVHYNYARFAAAYLKSVTSHWAKSSTRVQTIFMSNVDTQRQIVTAKNGRTIQATIFRPQGEVKAAVLIVAAMGVSQGYYAKFASWLAEQGYAVATFDYSGTGASRVGDPRRVDGDILDWARFDCDAMVDATACIAPGRPLYWIGHSLGGQILGFVPDLHRIAKMITVATGSGYWLENSWALRWRVWFFWFVFAPLLIRKYGYFPGKRFRVVGDLPRGVIQQWRRWCLDPEYAVGAEGASAREKFASVTLPITAISFTDDEMMSERNTASLHAFYSGAPRVMKRIAPRDIGVARIGHFGFFSARFKEALWRNVLLPELS